MKEYNFFINEHGVDSFVIVADSVDVARQWLDVVINGKNHHAKYGNTSKEHKLLEAGKYKIKISDIES